MKALRAVILDAMGVVYSVEDDVRDLLCPFIAEKGGSRDISRIDELYCSASLGNVSTFEFWQGVGVAPELEDEYLQRHRLSDGLLAFLEEATRRGHEMWCLSNDVSEWSKKLRDRFGLNKYFTGFIISGDAGYRKPDLAIYRRLIAQLPAGSRNAVFVDDRLTNLDSAAVLGFETVLFSPVVSASSGRTHKVATTFSEILSLL